jgi:8-oxo-dGTP pyrophosphatase MutT (NUDIX family)
MTISKETIQRRCVRAIVITPEAEVLLMQIRRPDTGEHFWITPGGGLEPEETQEAGLRRELREELGLTADFEIGPVLWRRHHTFDWAGKRLSQNEEYYVVRIDRFEPEMTDEVEAKVLQQFRWWPLAELAQVEEPVAPLALARIVSEYLAAGAPAGPLELEVLID